METLVRSYVVMTLVLTLYAQYAQSPESRLKIEIQVYNYSGVSAATLQQAERDAARIYGGMDIEISWLYCPFTAEQAAQNTACGQPASPTRLTLRLLSNVMAERLPLGGDIFGLALLPVDGGLGMTANVCAGRAREMAEARHVPEGLLLGHLMAHEVGHLLLGSSRHSVKGLMHIPWQGKELQMMSQGAMLFTSGEAERIRAQVLARANSFSSELK